LSNPRTKLLAVLESHGARLHALLTRLTLDRDAAEDLLQELFLKLDRAAGFADASDPAAYACRAAIHLAFDWQRGRPRKTQALAHDPPAKSSSPLAALVQREDFARILGALGQLPPLYRDCVVLHYLEHEPYEVVAAQVDKKPHQVRALCHKAIARLREILNEPPASIRKEANRDTPR
jgi:RNA polymerase sigma factor (sigma-70 family)